MARLVTFFLEVTDRGSIRLASSYDHFALALRGYKLAEADISLIPKRMEERD